jgi:hypothetical protein
MSLLMSALGQERDIAGHSAEVRSTPQSGHQNLARITSAQQLRQLGNVLEVNSRSAMRDRRGITTEF